MLTNEASIAQLRQRHATHAHSNNSQLYTIPRQELVEMFNVEKDAKNEAYYFILKFGLLDKFYEHCRGEKAPDWMKPEEENVPSTAKTSAL